MNNPNAVDHNVDTRVRFAPQVGRQLRAGINKKGERKKKEKKRTRANSSSKNGTCGKMNALSGSLSGYRCENTNDEKDSNQKMQE